MKIAFACFALAYLLLVVFGIRYMIAQEYMSYHVFATGLEFSDLSSSLQTVILAFMHIIGAGFLAIGITGGILLALPFRAQASWSRWALLVMGLVIAVPTLFATLTVHAINSAPTPWPATAAGIALLILGFAFSFRMQPK